jgi:hypothetical protein
MMSFCFHSGAEIGEFWSRAARLQSRVLILNERLLLFVLALILGLLAIRWIWQALPK